MDQFRQSRWKNLGVSLALLAASLVFAAAAGEAVLRLLGHRGVPQSLLSNVLLVDDPILDWRYVPGSEVVEGRVVYRYNRAGFRDVDHDILDDPGTPRILVLGDSVTEGRGVEWEGVFSAGLQDRLRGRFEVINLAQGGLNTPQEIHLLEQVGLAFQPHLVVLNFVLNDCDFYTQLAPAREAAAERDAAVGLLFDIPIDPRLKRLLKSSALVYFVKRRLEELKGRLLGSGETDYFLDKWKRPDNRRKVQDGFDHLLALRQAHQFDVVVIIWPLIAEYETYRFESIHRWVQKEAEARGFPVIDLLPHFADIPFRSLQVAAEDSVHPNARGHAIGVEAFLAWLPSGSDP